MSVNLLPQELRPKGYLVKLSKTIKKFALLATVVMLVTASVVLASYLLLKYQISSSIKKQNELKGNIKALEQTEQKIILIRDRLDKIGEIESTENIKGGVGILDDVLRTVQENVFFKEVELKPANAQIVIVAGNSLELTRFLSNLMSQVNLVRIDLVSLEYSPTKGYEMKLSLSR